MTNFPDRNTPRPGYDYSGSFPGNSPMWIIGALVVVLVLGGLWYGLSGPSVVPKQDASQPITQPAAPTTSPAIPSPTPKP